MTHRDDLARLSPLSVRCGDAAHRKACATQGPPVAESLDKPPLRSPMGHYQRSLVLIRPFLFFVPFRIAPGDGFGFSL